ncbi:MAG: L-serine ammonia-lyase, iron-sulfur-dependent subunit beta [Fusobacterium sp.]|nr:L-serine ammonia-lyase, iron-sulfur-dependent subunit beta [Fusobacterium sp.]
MRQSSLLDIISPVMVGPSSSHTAGAVRLGLLAKNVYDEPIEKITFKLYNSYAQTGKGHGTDKGLLAGVLGLAVDDVRIKDIFNSEIAKHIDYKFEYYNDFNRHPNAVDFIFEGKNKMQISGDSIGAGEIAIRKINDFSVKFTGKYNTLLLVYKDVKGMISKVSTIIQAEDVNIASLHCDRSGKGETASMCICLDGDLDKNAINKIEEINHLDMVRYVRKLGN